MREKIQEQLRRIEEAENIKILLAVESGINIVKSQHKRQKELLEMHS